MKKKTSEEMPLDPRLSADLHRLSETGIEPGRDLWPGLEREIREPAPNRRSRVPVYLAAAAVLVAGFVGGAWWLAHRPPPTPAFERFDAARSLADLPQASSEEFRVTFVHYLDERQQILDLVARQVQDYPPEVRDDIHRSIQVIERAMKEIESSIAQTPAEPRTETRLANLYELELRLLRVVSERLQGSASDGGMSL